MAKKITLVDSEQATMYPQTTSSQVIATNDGSKTQDELNRELTTHVKESENRLTAVEGQSSESALYIAGVKSGNTAVPKASNAENSAKLEGHTYQNILDTVSTEMSEALDGYVSTETHEKLAENVSSMQQTVNDAKTDIADIQGDITSLETKDAELTTKVSALEASVSSVYVPKGSVQDIAALKALTGLKEGYVYNVITGGDFGGDTLPDGANVVYLGTAEGGAENFDNWDPLGGIFDMSEYITKEELNFTKEGITKIIDLTFRYV